MKEIVLTGIKPTGAPHIGNFLGAIQPALKLSEDRQGFYFIADYHALTTVHDGRRLNDQIYELAAVWLAGGLDPEKTRFYRQSDIPEVFELAWILACMTPKGLLNRAHAYKDSVQNNIAAGNDPDKGINCGVYNYPTLMAADILAFGSHLVPVGQDQKQHLEITRDIARAFNQTYKPVLTIPEALIREEAKVIPGIDGRKMSKSYNNVIPLYAEPEKLRKIINRVVTDSKGVDEPKNPDECNLFAIYSHFASAEDIAKTREKYRTGGLGYGELKKELFELIDSLVSEGRKKYNYYLDNREEVDRILKEGAAKARSVAAPLLRKTRLAIGVE